MNPLDNDILIFPTYAGVFIPMSRHFRLWYPNCIGNMELKLWSQVQNALDYVEIYWSFFQENARPWSAPLHVSSEEVMPLLLAEDSRNFATGFTRRNRSRIGFTWALVYQVLLAYSKFSIRQKNMPEDLIGASNLPLSKRENSAEFFSLSFLFKVMCQPLGQSCGYSLSVLYVHCLKGSSVLWMCLDEIIRTVQWRTCSR